MLICKSNKFKIMLFSYLQKIYNVSCYYFHINTLELKGDDFLKESLSKKELRYSCAELCCYSRSQFHCVYRATSRYICTALLLWFQLFVFRLNKLFAKHESTKLFYAFRGVWNLVVLLLPVYSLIRITGIHLFVFFCTPWEKCDWEVTYFANLNLTYGTCLKNEYIMWSYC